MYRRTGKGKWEKMNDEIANFGATGRKHKLFVSVQGCLFFLVMAAVKRVFCLACLCHHYHPVISFYVVSQRVDATYARMFVVTCAPVLGLLKKKKTYLKRPEVLR